MVKLSEEKYKGLFLKAEDLGDETILVKIVNYGVVDVPNQEIPADVVYFDAFKRPLNLNKTNTAMIVSLFGDETEDWKGKTVRLTKSTANNPQTNKAVDVIRIRPYEKKAK